MTATVLPLNGAHGGVGTMPGALDRVALQPADVDGIVHDLTAAVLFARMLADETADTGERVVLADEPHGVGIALLADESDVARHVHIRRAAGHARHGVERRGADPVFDVGQIIVPEGLRPSSTRRAASNPMAQSALS